VLKGIISPRECPLFATSCTPVHPVGPCMVSNEGSCAAHYTYARKETKTSWDA
jgi:hydrogenase expression/formation protein HypD